MSWASPLVAIVLGGGVLAALMWIVAREAKAQERAAMEEGNAEAAKRIAEAEANAPRSKSDLVDRLRHGGKL